MALASFYESFFEARKGNPQLQVLGRPNAFIAKGVPPTQKIHATERPQELMNDIVKCFFPKSARILVPFLGSGVTLRALYDNEMWGLRYDLDPVHRDRFYARLRSDLNGRGYKGKDGTLLQV